jgi:hypothetical protein
MWQALQVVLGGFITIGTAVLVEYLRRPSLHLSIEDPPHDRQFGGTLPARDVRFLRVKLFNRPPPAAVRWLQRQEALKCRGTITFYRDDGGKVFREGMAVRWSESPEPIGMLTVEGREILILNPVILTTNVYPGESQLLDVAAQYDDDEDCYGRNNERYPLQLNLRNQNWKLRRGCYLVRVEIASSGHKCVSDFHLFNDVGRRAFRLAPATPEVSQRTDARGLTDPI